MKITMRCFPVVLLSSLFLFGGIATGSAKEVKTSDRPGIASVLEQITPAVVNISVTGHVEVQQSPLMDDPFFRRFFEVPDQPQSRETQSLGSGVIIDAENGYILTNHHVVDNAEKIEVILKDRRQIPAKVIGSDARTDVALIQIEADHLSSIPISDSDTLKVGDFVAAIGNPFGIGQTVTTGIVSALDRTGLNDENYEDFIQTDASINPGNSGGALVDYNGNLVGINTAIISPAGGNVGIGFAVPVNMAMSVVDQLLEYGEVKRGLLGVRITDLTPDVVDALDLQVTKGAVVSSVEPDSPAQAAGIEPGDVVVTVNNEPIEGASDLRNTIGLTRSGEEVVVGLIRDNKRLDFKVRIGEAPAEVAQSGVQADSTTVLDGAELSNIPSSNEAYGKVEGVLVTNVTQGSRAYRNGLEPGDIITAVNRRPVTSHSELTDVLKENTGTVAMNIRRGDQLLFLIMR